MTILLIAILAFSCKKDEKIESIVGSWKYKKTLTTYTTDMRIIIVDSIHAGIDPLIIKGTYTIDKNTITEQLGYLEAYTYTYKIVKDTLFETSKSNFVYKYIRQ